MSAPCSVNATGAYFLCFPRPSFKVAFCDLKAATSGYRSGFRLKGDVAVGDLACGYGLLRCGKPGDTFPVRLTVCLRRLDGAWTIVHEHHSVPAADT